MPVNAAVEVSEQEGDAVTMRNIMPRVLALLVGYGLIQMGNTLQSTLLSVRGGIEGFSTPEIGAVGAGFWGGIIVGSLTAGALIRRIGHIRSFATLGTVASTSPLLHIALTDPFAWTVARGLTGFCFAGMFIVVESWLSAVATDQTRGQILSIYGMTGLVAGIAGQLILPLTDPSGFMPFCIVATIISYALVPILLTSAVAPAPSGGHASIDLGWLYRQSPFGMVAGCLGGVTVATFFTLGPIFAQRRGLGIAEIALFMASGSLGGCLTAWPLGWLSDRRDRRVVLIGAAIAAAVSLLAMTMFVPVAAPVWILYLCAAIFGGAVVPTYSLSLAHVNDSTSKEQLVTASAGLLLVYGLGSAAGPVIAGFAMSASRYGLAYTLISTQFLIAGLGIYRLLRRARPSENKRRFAIEPPVPVGTALAPVQATAD